MINRRPRPVPTPVPPERPAPPADIAETVRLYNEGAKRQYELLAEIYVYCVRNRKHAVRFSNGGSWSNFQGGDRPDIHQGRHVDPMIPYVVVIE